MLCDYNSNQNKSTKNLTTEFKFGKTIKTLKLVKLAKFKNNQVNGIFNDNTTIIIHPGFEFLTYFHSDNKKIRIKADNLLKNHQIYLKFHLMLNIFNLFSNSIFSNNILRLYYKSIVLSQNESEIIFTSSELIKKSYWIYDESYFESDSFSYMIRSLDDLTKFYLLKSKRIIKIEYHHIIPDESTIDGNYVYIKMVKFYKMNSVPRNWRIPMMLLIKYFNLESLIQFNPSPEELKFMQSIQKSKEFYNPLLEIEENLNTIESESNNEKITKFSDDEINPIAFIFNNETGLDFLYSRNFTYIINNTTDYSKPNCEIINNEFPHLTNYTSNEMSILNYQLNFDEVIKSVETDRYLQLLKYETETIMNPNLKSDNLIEIIFELDEIKKYFNNNSLKLDYNQNNLREKSFHDNSTNDSFFFDGNDVLHYKVIKDLGEFFGFRNKAIKVKFYDRTILKINSCNKQICILDRYGQNLIFFLDNLDDSFADFIFYYEHALKFYHNCFFSYAEKALINERLKLFQELSEFSLRRIHDVKILCGNKMNKFHKINNESQFNNDKIDFSSEKFISDRDLNYHSTNDVNDLEENNINM